MVRTDIDGIVKLLAVDDEELNLDLIELTFTEIEDVEVIRAINGREALDLLPETDPDVVLLDLAMPVLNGFETMKIMKEDACLRKIPVIVITANAEEKHRALGLGADDFLAKPVDIEELKLRTFNHVRIKRFQDYLKGANEILEQRVRERTLELREALQLAHETEQEIAYRLGRAAEYRDTETGGHLQRMTHYSALLAELAGLPQEEVDLVRHAAPLHDIGKVGIPDEVLLKPGKLTEEEFALMQQHAAIGAEMLDGCERYALIHAGRIIALQHHEKYDGSGYPNGLAGEEIHLYGRIVAITDVFDALGSRRVYKPAMAVEEVLKFMASQRGRHFDPGLLDLLFDNIERFLAIKDSLPDVEGEALGIAEYVGGRQ